MLKNAVNLATALQDTERQCKLHRVLMEFRNMMQAIELGKNDLENHLDETLRNIQEQRAALNRMEQEAKLGMVQQDRENTARISTLFEVSIGNLTSIDESSANSIEQDNVGDLDSGEAFDDVITGEAPDKHSAEGSHPTTDEDGSENSNSKPSNQGDNGAGTADFLELITPRIEDDDSKLSS